MKANNGVTLEPLAPGIARVFVNDPCQAKNLSWDRFVRLRAAAEAVLETKAKTALDVGGYDGALGLFLPDLVIDLVDPATTGGSVLSIAGDGGAYDVVAAIDVLEHIEPNDRARALSEFARLALRHVILNYPCRDSKDAQELALKLTNNDLVREHVQWELPDTDWVLSEMAKNGFNCSVRSHTSIAVWLGQYVALNLLPEAATELNRHLVKNYPKEPCSRALYHLVVCERASQSN